MGLDFHTGSILGSSGWGAVNNACGDDVEGGPLEQSSEIPTEPLFLW